jgi:hypothetical protein
MKTFRILFLAALVMLPLFALAKLSMPDGVLGRVESGLDFCAQVDPQSASKYQEKKKTFVQGASEEEVKEARASQQYRENYQAATDELSKQPKDEAKKSCVAALQGKS